jgi:hypothetical protein
MSLKRTLDHLAVQLVGPPNAIRMGKEKEFCGHAMLLWAHLRGDGMYNEARTKKSLEG